MDSDYLIRSTLTALTNINPKAVTAAKLKPAFHQTCVSLGIDPNCFKCLKMTFLKKKKLTKLTR